MVLFFVKGYVQRSTVCKPKTELYFSYGIPSLQSISQEAKYKTQYFTVMKVLP